MTVQTALQQGFRLLEDGAVPASRLTAEVLLCQALGCERAHLYSHPEQELSDQARIHYGRFLYERLEGKPTQYITGCQEFYGREFVVTPAVLIPRPETEHVVETALSLWNGSGVIVDVGCGSGAIAITLAMELGAGVWATDISLAALEVAAANARRLGAHVQFLACDLTSALAGGAAGLLVSNPPYVALSDRDGLQREVRDYEPHVALFAGATGMEIYQRIVSEAERLLRPGGAMVLELGFQSSEAVRAMLSVKWRDVRLVPDLAGIPRVLAATLKP